MRTNEEYETKAFEAAGRRIKLARRRLGFSQEKFCAEFSEKGLWGAEFNVKTLRAYENKGGLRWRTVEIFATYFRISVEVLTNLEFTDQTVAEEMVRARRRLKEAHFSAQSGRTAESSGDIAQQAMENEKAARQVKEISFDWERLAHDMAQLEDESVYGDRGYTLRDIFIYPQADLKIGRLAEWEHVGCLRNYLGTFDFEASKSQNHPIVIYGDFGIGKSSFLKMLCSALISSEHPLLPIYIPLRDLPLYDSLNLVNAVKQYLSLYGTIDFTHVPNGILLLLDGFDELNFYNDTDNWISRSFDQLLSLLRFTNVYLVISSRPIMFLKDEDHIPANSPIFRICEFDDLTITEWIKKWKQLPETRDSDISFDNLKQRGLISIVKNPLLLYMTAKLFDTELKEKKSYSKGIIYKLFYDWTIKGKFILDKHAYKLPANYRQILQNIAMAIRYMGSNAEYISFDNLQKYIVEFQDASINNDIFELNELILNAHFFAIKEEKALRYIEFTHKSFREYLVAEKIYDCLGDFFKNNDIDYSKWLTLGRHLPSEDEINFLKDLLYTLPDDNLIWIYSNMSAGNGFIVGHGHFKEILNKARLRSESEIGTVYYRSINLATLAFIICNIIHFRLKTRWNDISIDPSTRSRLPLINKIFHLCHTASTSNGAYLNNWTIAKRFMSGINLSGLGLDGIDLSNAELDDADLSKTSLRRTSLIHSRLMFSDLSNAVCNGSDFTGAYLNSVHGINTIFNQVTFNNAQLYYTTFDKAEFINVDFSDTIFTKCKFKECLFKNIINDNTELIDCEGFDFRQD